MLLILLAATVAAAGSTVYPVFNHERVAGSMIVTHSADTVTVRYVFTDRNRGSRDLLRFVSHDGRLVSSQRRAVLLNDQPGEPSMRVEVIGGSIRRWSSAGTTTERYDPETYYGSAGTPYEDATLARLLRRTKRHTGKLWAMAIKLDVLKKATVPTAHGSEDVKLVSLEYCGNPTPQLLWLDANDDLFATEVDWFMTVKAGAEPAHPTLRKIEVAYRDAQAEALNARVMTPRSTGIAIRNGNLFDSERGVMVPGTTVVVRGDRIVVDIATAHCARADAGKIASPRNVLASFIEGTTKRAGPTSVLVSTEAEARSWLAKYDSMGYKQIKMYNVVHPDLVPVIATEAHKRGMRVCGHIPRGLSVQAAVLLGFDEIQHAAFFFSTFYQDSLYVPTMRAYSLVASVVAPNVDVDGQPMTDLIAFLKRLAGPLIMIERTFPG